MEHAQTCIDALMLNHRISRNDAMFICYTFEIPPNDLVELHEENIGILIDTKLSDLISETDEEIQSIYINDPFHYKQKADKNTVHKHYTATIIPKDFICGICQESSNNEHTNKHVCLNKCTHIYHKECIDIWLTTAKLTCPMCNNQLVDNADD